MSGTDQPHPASGASVRKLKGRAHDHERRLRTVEREGALLMTACTALLADVARLQRRVDALERRLTVSNDVSKNGNVPQPATRTDSLGRPGGEGSRPTARTRKTGGIGTDIRVPVSKSDAPKLEEGR